MVLKVVDRVRDQLNVALLEVRLMDRQATQLGGAHRSEVARVRKEHTPAKIIERCDLKSTSQLEVEGVYMVNLFYTV